MSQIPHNFFVAQKLYRFGYQTISFFIVFEIYAEWWFVWNLFFHLTLIVCKGKGAHILGVDDMHTKRIFPLEKCCALWAACAAAVLAACSVPALQTIVQFQALKFANILIILLFVCLIWDPSSFPSWKVLCTLSCLCFCYSCCLLSSWFTNNHVISGFLFCKYSCHFLFASAVHFELLVLLLFLLLAQFMLYKQLL